MIVAFSGFAGSGKTLAAVHLATHFGFTRHRFAGPLKDMLRCLGLSDREIEGDLKEQPCEILCGQTPRWAMQSIGTDWGRAMIGPDVWVRAWKATLPKGNVVVDDVRFANEATVIRELGGKIIQVTRPGYDGGWHISEALPFQPDSYLTNDNEPADLLRGVEKLCYTTERICA